LICYPSNVLPYSTFAESWPSFFKCPHTRFATGQAHGWGRLGIACALCAQAVDRSNTASDFANPPLPIDCSTIFDICLKLAIVFSNAHTQTSPQVKPTIFLFLVQTVFKKPNAITRATLVMVREIAVTLKQRVSSRWSQHRQYYVIKAKAQVAQERRYQKFKPNSESIAS